MRNKFKVGLLDFGLRDSAMNSLSIIQDVLDYAQLADELGFSRIWLSEHHLVDPRAAWYNPLMLIPILAGTTSKIIVGVGGVQISVHNPYDIAINLKLLANLFPNRIDLGIAGGTPDEYIKSLIKYKDSSLEEKKNELLYILQQEDSLLEKYSCTIPPFKGAIPNIWMLGSGYSKLNDVIKHGTSFARSLFHGLNTQADKDVLENFKQEYFKVHNREPQISLAFSGCCHKTEALANRVARDSNYDGIASINIKASENRFHETLCSYNELYGINEFIFLNVARSPKDRRIGLELISKHFN